MSLPQVRQSRTVWEYFHAKLGLHPSDDFRGVCHFAPGIDITSPGMDDVAVAVGYNSFVGRSCCMHVVVQKPEFLHRAMVREAFEFPFLQCGVEAIIALVDSVNEPALSFDRRLGFVEVARVPNGGVDGDLVILQMLRSGCRWLRMH